uniref:Uncharacterized protein n=1 Tax=Solanum tuberosum TaxID=4113 RepID=M1DZH2_SOLTU
MEKDHDRHQNIAKIMRPLDILSKNDMGGDARGVNAVGVGCANPEETRFEALYNEEVEVWKVFKKVQGGGKQVQSASRRSGRQTRPRRLTQDIFKLESVKLGEPRKIISESPTISAISTKTVVWTPTATRGPIKFGKAIENPACRRVARRALLMSQNITKSKAVERIMPAQEKSKGIAIKEDAVTWKGKASKLPTATGKGKGKRPTSTRKTITLDLNIPSWAKRFCRAMHVFLADSHSTDLGEFGTVVPPEVTSGTDPQAQGDVSGTNA